MIRRLLDRLRRRRGSVTIDLRVDTSGLQVAMRSASLDVAAFRASLQRLGVSTRYVDQQRRQARFAQGGSVRTHRADVPYRLDRRGPERDADVRWFVGDPGPVGEPYRWGGVGPAGFDGQVFGERLLFGIWLMEQAEEARVDLARIVEAAHARAGVEFWNPPHIVRGEN